ncbi:hypothetical protein PGTUg99_000989 [Puccinia graminis f. sp. tritici]|uniref:Uncharacterized protein n=1 Tax=Puccinia graminis f. sp. tritici TaxID=56615 RepID=A0A5B0NAS2_PUCGR|nr:hypothetical protein PGTUg99_000989 [Puccinia graminis f. sp. tritici]
MSTRSNNPNLHGPLPPATRPRRIKSAGGTGEPFEINNNSKETSSDSHRGDGNIGSQWLSPDKQSCDDRSGKKPQSQRQLSRPMPQTPWTWIRRR